MTAIKIHTKINYDSQKTNMLKIKDTMSSRLKKIEPKDKEPFYMYVCGITPYDSSHLGHARTFISFDIIRRWMQYGHNMSVVYIQNVTDIDDKIINRAKQKAKLPLELAKEYDEQFKAQAKILNILPATHMPRISEHIAQTIEMIQKLLDAQIAYITDTGVYYDISKFENYGKLSKQNLDKIKAGARIEIDEKKKNPVDFALWKFSDEKGASYDSPWGRGRPGWHIECSAMSMHYTNGKSLDLHAGARDLIFPHHENEIAQSEGAGYCPFCKIWTHTGFLTVNKEKMSKSLGNFITIDDALNKNGWKPEVLRLFFAQTHYSSPIDFSKQAIESAKNTFDNIKQSLAIMHGDGEVSDKQEELTFRDRINSYMSKFSTAMDNDFDTPTAISELILASKEVARARAENKVGKDELENAVSKIIEKFDMLGIVIVKYEFTSKKSLINTDESISDEEITKKINEREIARKDKDYQKADKIREELKKAKVMIEDSKDGKVRYRRE